MQNIFAHTEPGSEYQAYLSINKDNEGRYIVTVRSPGNAGRDMGTIHVSPETLEHMATDVLAAINGEPATCQGANCGTIDGLNHSPECVVEAAACQGWLASTDGYEAMMKVMVDRFLGWKLPEDFYPDAGISFDREYAEKWGMPIGTNLLHSGQALEMFKHCLPAELIAASEPERQCCGACDKPEASAIGNDTLTPEPLTADQYRAVIQDLANRLQTADLLIAALIGKAGGVITLCDADGEVVIGQNVISESDADSKTITFKLVPVPQQAEPVQ